MAMARQRRRKQQQQLEEVDFGVVTAEARKYVWSGAVPVQIRLHPSEISTTAASSSSSLVSRWVLFGYFGCLLPYTIRIRKVDISGRTLMYLKK